MQACHYMVNFFSNHIFSNNWSYKKKNKGWLWSFSLLVTEDPQTNVAQHLQSWPGLCVAGHKTRYYSPDQIINPPLLPCSNNVPLPAQSPFIADQKRSGLESSCKQLILETSSLWHGSTGRWHGGGAAHCTQCQNKNVTKQDSNLVLKYQITTLIANRNPTYTEYFNVIFILFTWARI